MHLSTDVLVVGAGGAGMYAALAAARAGAGVILADKNMIGRGGATVMAQMTVAAALAEQEPDTWEDHLADTLAAGRGLCDESLAEVLCRVAPERMREMDDWGVGWARSNGRIRQVMAPGHGRRRCCYVDFLNTGPAVAGTLRKRVGRTGGIRALSNVAITDLVVKDGSVRGALALALGDGAEIGIEAGATVIATGGLTKLYARSSASNNMAGEGYALALRAGAALVDMEFVQFFPIGHLAPRLVGMDPIMWDPFRYKLGGRLLNGAMEEVIDRYGGEDSGRYTATRDLATYAICREVDAGRGSPSGGAWLSFTHLPETDLRDAFGPVIDRLLRNGIDLTREAVEVAPIAHYHMGGVKVDTRMRSTVAGLYAAGEAVGGAAGANRLSGNAISEALVFGEIAGREAATYARDHGGGWDARAADAARGTAASRAHAATSRRERGGAHAGAAGSHVEGGRAVAQSCGADGRTRSHPRDADRRPPASPHVARHRVRHRAHGLARVARGAARRGGGDGRGARPRGEPRRPPAGRLPGDFREIRFQSGSCRTSGHAHMSPPIIR